MSVQRRFYLAVLVAAICFALGMTLRGTNDLEGSMQQVTSVLNKQFPAGTDIDIVFKILKERFGINKSDINIGRFESKPSPVIIGNKEYAICSWATADLYHYRSLRRFYFKTSVGAQFQFDCDNRLVRILPIIAGGPEF